MGAKNTIRIYVPSYFGTAVELLEVTFCVYDSYRHESCIGLSHAEILANRYFSSIEGVSYRFNTAPVWINSENQLRMKTKIKKVANELLLFTRVKLTCIQLYTS